MGRKSASGFGIRDEQPGFFVFFGVKILKFFDADPGSGMETVRIRDQGWTMQSNLPVSYFFLTSSYTFSSSLCNHPFIFVLVAINFFSNPTALRIRDVLDPDPDSRICMFDFPSDPFL
jgi:hypothetical protein